MKRTNPLISAVSFRFVLLDSYKKMGFTEEEVIVILMVDHLLEQGNVLITNDMLSLKMNYKPSEVDKIMVSLIKKGAVSYMKKGNAMATSLDALKEKVYGRFQENLEKERLDVLDKEREDSLVLLSSFFENKLNRTLSPLESSMLKDWLDAGFKVDEIKASLLDSLSLGKKSFRSVDKILRSKRTDADIRKEGYSATSSTWDKDIEETMKIAKQMWGDDDGKK